MDQTVLKQAEEYITAVAERGEHGDWYFKDLAIDGIALIVKLLLRMCQHIEEEWDD